MKIVIFMIGIGLVGRASAAVLATLPSPVEQGGMIHVNVSLNGSVLGVQLDPGTPALKPLAAWKPGDRFDAASPWYSTLDPDQMAGLFNSRFGFVLDGESDLLPEGSRIQVAVVVATPGLETYRWRNNAPQLFEPILGTGGSGTSWNWGSVNHGMMHPMFVMPAGSSGTASATLSFTLADSSGMPLLGYDPAITTLDFTIVPEPAGVSLLVSACGLFLFRRRP